MSNAVNNNILEVKPSPRLKRKISAPCTTAYMNPAMDLLSTEDKICNTVMEVELPPCKRKKITSNCSGIAAFDNTGLDLGVTKEAINAFLNNELRNVKSTLKVVRESEPEYANITEFNNEINNKMQSTCSKVNHSSTIIINNDTGSSLSFIDRLGLDSPNPSNQSLYLDDDLNESNIMEIKTITIITKKKKVPENTNIVKNTNPFLADYDINDYPIKVDSSEPICAGNNLTPDYSDQSNVLEFIDESICDVDMVEPTNSTQIQPMHAIPRRLFAGDITNSTISTINDENIYENVDPMADTTSSLNNTALVNLKNDVRNKQSKILGYDVSNFDKEDILNVYGKGLDMEASYCSIKSNETTSNTESKKNGGTFVKFPKIKIKNKLHKRVLHKIKKTFKNDKHETTLSANPYEIPRKVPKSSASNSSIGFENPALNLDYSDEVEMNDSEEEDEEHMYETIKTCRNTQLNTNITPMKERNNDNHMANSLCSSNAYTPSKKHVRFDSTLNQEKIISGNSFDSKDSCDISLGPSLDIIDCELNGYHDELENCINEKKIIALNM